MCRFLLAACGALLACGGNQGWNAGIQARLAWSTQGLRVLSIPSDSPAREMGLQVNDRIVAIDGWSISGKPYDQVIQRLRGPVGSEVILKTVDEQNSERVVRVIRMPHRAPR